MRVFFSFLCIFLLHIFRLSNGFGSIQSENFHLFPPAPFFELVDHGVSDLVHKAPTPTVATIKSTSKVLVPIKTTDPYDGSEKSNSGSPGDVLGLASYASDDDDDNETESSIKPSVKENNIQQQSTPSKLSKGIDLVDNGGSVEENKDHDNLESDLGSSSQNATRVNNSVAVSELKDEKAANTSNSGSGEAELEMLDSIDSSKFKKTLPAKVAGKSEKVVENRISRKSVMDDSLGRDQEIRDKLDKFDRRDHERNPTGKNHSAKEVEIDKESAHEKEGTHSRHIKKERRENKNGSKERVNEKGVKSAEKAKDTDSRKRLSPDYDKEGKRERHVDRRTSFKEENDGIRERTKDDKREKTRHRNSSESSRHKRHRSSSVASRSRDNKDGSVVGHTSDSSDESSDNSKRFVYQFIVSPSLIFAFDLSTKGNIFTYFLLLACRKLQPKRRKSPSPVRSRKRYYLSHLKNSSEHSYCSFCLPCLIPLSTIIILIYLSIWKSRAEK